MKIELAHDLLARRIYDKSSAEDKTRLKINNFIKQRFQFYESSQRRILLKRTDLNYIEPYLSQLVLTDEEQKFIDRSKKVIKRRIAITIAFIIVTIIGLFVYSQLMRKWKNDAMEAEEKAKVIGGKLEAANNNLKRAVQQNEEITAFVDTVSDRLGISRGSDRSVIIAAVNKHLHAMEEVDSVNKAMMSKLARKEADLKKADLQYTQHIRQIVELTKQNDKLTAENKTLRDKLSNNTNTTTLTSSKVTEANTLAGHALSALRKGDKNLAFQLASAAYNRDSKNEEAEKILRGLAKERLDAITYKTAPVSSLIRTLSSKSHYGSLYSERELKPYLK